MELGLFDWVKGGYSKRMWIYLGGKFEGIGNVLSSFEFRILRGITTYLISFIDKAGYLYT